MTHDMLFARLAEPNARTALVVDGARLDYAQPAAASAAHVAFLERAGIRPGDRVAVWTQRALETPVALVAHAPAGVVTVPPNPGLGERELRHVLDDARPRGVVAARPEAVRDRTPDVRSIELHRTPGERLGSRRAGPDEPLLVLYTSGTTGAPKGAVLSAGNVATNPDSLAEAWAWTERDTVVHALPLFHVHGLELGLFGSLRVGGALHWVTRLAPETVAPALADGGIRDGEASCAVAPSPPRSPTAARCSSVCRRCTTGSPTRPSAIGRWRRPSAVPACSSRDPRRSRCATTGGSSRRRAGGSSSATASPRRSSTVRSGTTRRVRAARARRLRASSSGSSTTCAVPSTRRTTRRSGKWPCVGPTCFSAT